MDYDGDYDEEFDVVKELGLPPGVYDLKIGKSFFHETGFHTLKYDFKPASVDESQSASIYVGKNNKLTVTVPNPDDHASNTVYKGSVDDCDDDWVFVIDSETREITLEQLTSNIVVKKTRSDLETINSDVRNGGDSVPNQNSGDLELEEKRSPVNRNQSSPKHKFRINPTSRNKSTTKVVSEHKKKPSNDVYPRNNRAPVKPNSPTMPTNDVLLPSPQVPFGSLPMIGDDFTMNTIRPPSPASPVHENNYNNDINNVGTMSDSSSSSSASSYTSDSDSEPEKTFKPDRVNHNDKTKIADNYLLTEDLQLSSESDSD
ncbi:ell-associated factor Eaf [Trichogramma pretiosum]|uniref:ell-associated factor Eaf n=1 Tax=Trichogramma pretiosum TaxID=7493 RepID=UPI0006C9B39A|nr:ell-associated factor Eaf [Trichogramma pretiosum]